MTVPKYVRDLMSRAKYNYSMNPANDSYAVGYTVDIAKRSHQQMIGTFREEISKLESFVKRNGGEMIVVSVPTVTKFKYMQYITVTIFDPVMKGIEPFITSK